MAAFAKVEPCVLVVGLLIILGCHFATHSETVGTAEYARQAGGNKEAGAAAATLSSSGGPVGVKRAPDTFKKMRFATILSEPRKYYCPFLASAVMNDIDMEVFGWNYNGISGTKGWWRKILFFDHMSKKYDPEDILVFVDSNDVLFNAKPDEIRKTFLDQVGQQGLTHDNAWIWSAELNCGMKTISKRECETLHKTDGRSRYKYMNTGAFIGRAGTGVDIMRMVNEDRAGRTQYADQCFIAYSQHKRGWRDVYGLDYNQSIFMSVYLAENDICGGPPDFQTPLGNCKMGTTPGVYHFNAGAKDKFYEPVMKKTWWYKDFDTPEGREKVDNAIITVNSRPVKLKQLCPRGYGKVRDHRERQRRDEINLGEAEKFDIQFEE